jgi:hypothetical protein
LFKSFQIIDDFIKDIYGFPFISQPRDSRIQAIGIKELSDAYVAMMDILRQRRKPLSDEFIRAIYPLLEISIHWVKLKEQKQLSREFIRQSKIRMKKVQNFYGAVFELDMASRCLLSNWGLQFVEDCRKKKEKQIDFIFRKDKKAVGVECLSKRFKGAFSPENLTIADIDYDITEHAKKFKSEYINKLGISLDERILVVDITLADYRFPKHLIDGLENIKTSRDLDAVVFTWREDLVVGQNHSLKVKYKTIGSQDRPYFSLTYAAEFHGDVFFMRPYIEPEPTVWSASGIIRGG